MMSLDGSEGKYWGWREGGRRKERRRRERWSENWEVKAAERQGRRTYKG